MHHTPARESSVRPPRTRARLLILAAVVLALLVSVLTTTRRYRRSPALPGPALSWSTAPSPGRRRGTRSPRACTRTATPP